MKLSLSSINNYFLSLDRIKVLLPYHSYKRDVLKTIMKKDFNKKPFSYKGYNIFPHSFYSHENNIFFYLHSNCLQIHFNNILQLSDVSHVTLKQLFRETILSFNKKFRDIYFDKRYTKSFMENNKHFYDT